MKKNFAIESFDVVSFQETKPKKTEKERKREKEGTKRKQKKKDKKEERKKITRERQRKRNLSHFRCPEIIWGSRGSSR